MKSLHLFYPSHEISLAHGPIGFTPPSSAERLRRAGEYLPLWLGKNGDTVLVDNIDPQYICKIQSDFNVGISAIDDIGSSHYNYTPWGWSYGSRQLLIKSGADNSDLPSVEIIDKIKALSHRKTSIIINRILQEQDIHTPYIPILATTVKQAGIILHDLQRAVIKAPWSSSGRGVIDSATLPTTSLLTQIEGIIKHQGSVIIEPFLNKVQDFAMLFNSRNGKVEYVGLSVFNNSTHCNYAGNIVAPESRLLKILETYISSELLRELKESLLNTLPEVLADYCGNLGIDMLVYQTGEGAYAVAPCIELNLRTTMGFIACSLAESFLSPDSSGRFYITPGKLKKTLKPAIIADNKLHSGQYLLSPLNPCFNFIFEAQNP